MISDEFCTPWHQHVTCPPGRSQKNHTQPYRLKNPTELMRSTAKDEATEISFAFGWSEKLLGCRPTHLDRGCQKNVTPRPHCMRQRIMHSFYDIPHHVLAHVWGQNPCVIMVAHTHTRTHTHFSVNTTIDIHETHFGVLWPWRACALAHAVWLWRTMFLSSVGSCRLLDGTCSESELWYCEDCVTYYNLWDGEFKEYALTLTCNPPQIT